MSLIDVSLPKKYKDGQLLYEETLDAWRQATEAAFARVNLNLTQIALDVFPSNYDYNNSGTQTLTTDVYQYITNVITGATPITGTSSDFFTINTDGFGSTLTTASMTASRTHSLPDIDGTFATLEGNQTFTGTKLFNSAPQLPPIGTIIPFYDFDGAATFSTTYWAYCDGSTKTLGGGIGSKTLPDLSNRYLVGYGTEAGGDIDTAAWNAAATGNASHQKNLAHTHTGPSHTHTGPSHTHTGPSHSHSVPAHYHGMGAGATLNIINSGAHTHYLTHYANNGGGGEDQYGIRGTDVYYTDETGSTQHSHDTAAFAGVIGLVTGGVNGNASMTSGTDGTGATGDAGTGATGASGTDATGSTLSATEDIQPRSIRVRYIMRIL